jgi:hypothetical protein
MALGIEFPDPGGMAMELLARNVATACLDSDPHLMPVRTPTPHLNSIRIRKAPNPAAEDQLQRR